MIIIERIELDDVLTGGKDRFNSNNHWENNIKPVDYDNKLSETETRYWIDKFHDSYTVINVNKKNLPWLKDAANIGKVTGNFSHIYDEDLEDLVSSHKFANQDNVKYFVRAESVSLKTGCNGVGPYLNVKSMIQSLVTSRSTHTPIKEDTKHVKLYLLPWVDISHEFRVFVHNKKITAISQQHLYEKDDYLHQFESDERNIKINEWVNLINYYFNSTISSRIDIDSYVIDVAILSDGSPYFIEINTFGKEYASGSSLYHWIIDEKILYGNGDDIYFRYV
ncbi:MAG: hypothetical protein Terrestrivirus2_182 [Terrestrivirus sp.]|uniref:Uncharacterized protein n=1 Tax=Terrestrivirus sp. TaxID=2487775 RepID=A0A3G4ZMN1_9VIRU|nr:MAG: hypothetical protein Terrestrivirus2_182 [Terrestrivirus sp.]